MATLWSLFSNSTAVDTHRLVGERTAILADNTQSVKDVALETEHLSECYKALETANPTILDILANPSKERLTQEEIAEMLRKLALVMTTDTYILTEDLETFCQKIRILKTLIQKMKELEGHCDTALSKLDEVTAMDERNIEDLTTLRGKAMQADLQSMCRDGSGFG
jgi:hypothetical protein